MKKILSIFLCFAIMSFFFAFSGCGTEAESNTSSDKISVVTTIFPYYDFVRQLAGDKADVRLLLSPGSEPHSYEPSPSDIVAIENCDIFIYNGGESDEWVDDVLGSTACKSTVTMKMTDYVPLRLEQSAEHTDDESGAHKEGDEYDEHIWTSVRNAERLAASIADELMTLDEGNKSYYEKTKSRYISSLDELDRKFTDVVNDKKRNTIVFGDRFPFLYFVSDYGLDYECAFPGCSSETEPSTAVVAHLIDYTKQNNIPIVFYLELSSGKIAQIISEDSSAVTMRFFSCHTVSKEDFENGATYISLMEQNLKALKEAIC